MGPLPRPRGPIARRWALAAVLAAGCSAEPPLPDRPDVALPPPSGGGGSTELAYPGETGPVRRVLVDFGGASATVEAQQIRDELVFEGDILLGPAASTPEAGDGVHVAAVAALPSRYLWPDGRVFYTIDPALPNQARVREAIAHWEARTRIRFVPRGGEPNFVTFRRGAGCSADLGMTGRQQYVNLADACTAGTTIHEIGHTVGMWHEQSRADRDSYVIVRWENIEPGQESNFRTYAEQGFGGVDIGPYDYDSVMHYGSAAFSRNGRPTIVRRDGSTIPGFREQLSGADVAGVGHLYACRYGAFVDICDSPFKDDIVFIYDRGIARGCTAEQFCPGAPVTRAQMATFLTRALMLGPGPDAFDDDNGDTHEAAINSLAAAGIAQGCGPRRFCPGQPVSRGAMAAFLRRAFGLAPGPDAFDDDSGNTHEESINAVAAAGIVNGCAPRRYCPGNPVTRGQMAAMLRRALMR